MDSKTLLAMVMGTAMPLYRHHDGPLTFEPEDKRPMQAGSNPKAVQKRRAANKRARQARKRGRK